MKTILALLALATGSQAQTTINGGRQITGNLDFTNSNSATVSFPNAGSTGTMLNKLAKLAGAPSTVVITATSDTNGAVGIITSGAGTTGSATIGRFGIVACVFDGATTANDYVQISGTTAGDCHDSGATIPSSGQVIGAVLSTNGSGGTYNVLIWPEGNVGGNSGGGGGGDEGGILTLATGTGSPGGNCIAPSSGNLAAYTDTTNQDLWICVATNIWKKVLSTTNTGVFVQTGATGTSPGAPASGNVTCYYDSTANTMLCLDLSGNVFASVKTASSRTANQFMTYVNSLGLPQTAAIAAADIPNLSGTYCALSGCSMFGTLITSGVNAGGVWPSAIDIDTLGSPGGNWGNIYTDAITMPSQTAKTFFAAPTGSAGVPTFRALASADLPATVVLTNQANTYSAGLQDFSAVNFKAPAAAGFTATASNMVGYDSTNLNFHVYNGADGMLAPFPSTPTTGHCIQATVASGKITLADAGGPCTTGGGSGTVSSGTVHGVAIYTGATTVGSTSVGASNTLLHGNTGADPTYSQVATGDIANNALTSAKMAVVNTRRTCLIENDTQSATALTAAQMSGKCTIPAAATIVEVDVSGGTQVLTGSATAPTYTGASSIQIGKHGASNSTGLLSAALATVSGVACALTSTSGTCLFNNAMTSSSSVTISTTALAAGDQIYVSAATADGAQTWYHVAVIYTIN